jgi:hypothetical protein
MKRTLRFLCVVGLAAAFLLMTAAMVLPHSNAVETAHHACWICHSKAIGVAAPEAGAQSVALRLISLAAPAARPILESQAAFLFSEARAPPQF